MSPVYSRIVPIFFPLKSWMSLYLPALFPNIAQQILQMDAGQGIQRAERFVHQQHVRLLRQCPGNGHPLLHAAGQLAGVFVGRMPQLHQRKVLF